MNTELMKAVERLRLNSAVDTDTYHAITDGVRDLEAENARLESSLAWRIDRVCKLQYRLTTADELLRKATEWNWLEDRWPAQMESLNARITAHLGADHG